MYEETVFWDVAPCMLLHTDCCLRGAYCLHRQGEYVRLHGATSHAALIFMHVAMNIVSHLMFINQYVKLSKHSENGQKLMDSPVCVACCQSLDLDDFQYC